MSHPDLPGHGRDSGSPSGYKRQSVHISGGAKAHLGGTYYVSESTPKESKKQMLSRTLGLDNPLNRLPYAEDASFNSYRRQHEPTYLPETRVDILREIHNWASEHDDCSIFWLNGLTGTGKPTIARTSMSGMLWSAV